MRPLSDWSACARRMPVACARIACPGSASCRPADGSARGSLVFFVAALVLLGLCSLLAAPLHAESAIALDSPVELSDIGATTFDDRGRAVGRSSFELETEATGVRRMRVQMAITGGGKNVSEATLAPIPISAREPAALASSRPTLLSPLTPPSATAAHPSLSSVRGPIAGSLAGGAAGAQEPALRLVEERSQATRADGVPLDLLVIDHVAGKVHCIPPDAADGEGKSVALPENDRVVNVPMQLLFIPLVRKEVDELRFQIAVCKDGPAFHEMIAVRGPTRHRDGREVLEIRYGPDFGKTVAFFASRLLPSFSFWFDARSGEYLGHRMPLYRDGPRVLLVRAGLTPPALGFD